MCLSVQGKIEKSICKNPAESLTNCVFVVYNSSEYRKCDDGDSMKSVNAAASRGRWKPGASNDFGKSLLSSRSICRLSRNPAVTGSAYDGMLLQVVDEVPFIPSAGMWAFLFCGKQIPVK